MIMKEIGMIDKEEIVIGEEICGKKGNGMVEIVEWMIEMKRMKIEIEKEDIGGVILRIKMDREDVVMKGIIVVKNIEIEKRKVGIGMIEIRVKRDRMIEIENRLIVE